MGILRPPTNFGGGCETGIVAKEKFTGDCEHGPREFQLDIIHHGFETHIQAISAAGASKKTEIGVRYGPQPTFRGKSVVCRVKLSRLGVIESR